MAGSGQDRREKIRGGLRADPDDTAIITVDKDSERNMAYIEIAKLWFPTKEKTSLAYIYLDKDGIDDIVKKLREIRNGLL